MATKYISIRVLQHDKDSDHIHIGNATFLYEDQMDKAVQDTITQYEQKSGWCGGFQAACQRYYKRIAIVDADTLEVIRSIYERKEANNENIQL